MKARLVILSFLLGFFLQGTAMAWETGLNDREDWLSIYVDMNAKPGEGAWEQFHDNEHAEHSYMALRNLVQGSSPAIEGVFPAPFRRETYFVYDLNASLFRPELKEYHTPVGVEGGDRKKIATERAIASREAPFETRWVPPPHMFAGVPDFSYSMYDWINKNSLCPSLPEGQPDIDLCHAFLGWMGAMNSNHFGTQTWMMYRHIHELAMDLAARAGNMRRKLEANAQDLEAHKLYVHEAELMALAFEGYGQHFLQDRWSTGHMWERWNSSSYRRMERKDILDGMLVAAIAGLLHGSQSLTGLPDPMCSPAIVPYRSPGEVRAQSVDLSFPGGRKMAVPLSWRHCRDKTCPPVLPGSAAPKHPGVGDHRLLDMYDGGFGKEFSKKTGPDARASGIADSKWTGPDYPIEVNLQKREMMNCAMAGWAEVIRKFGTPAGGEGFGIGGIRLKEDLKDVAFETLRHGCSDMWVTNESMALGWGDFDKALTFGGDIFLVSDYGKTVLKDMPKVARMAGMPALTRLRQVDFRRDLLRLSFGIYKGVRNDPDGISLAAGGLGDFRGIAPGDRNIPAGGVPEYTEPVRLDSLKDRDPATGKDLESIFGFFNRAAAEYWCGKIGNGFLDELRGSDDFARRGACIYLADRVYAGTDPSYDGVQKEVRTLSGKRDENPSPVNPLCDYFNLKDAGGDRLPRRLHPGYVGTPYARDKSDLSFGSVANWCDNVPLLDLLPDPALKNADVVAVVRDLKRDIRIDGRSLGREEGLLQSEGAALGHMTIVNWSDSGFVFRLPEELEIPGGDYRFAAVRADGRRTPGRYILRVDLKPGKTEEPKKEEPAKKPPEGIKTVDCSALRKEYHRRCKEMADKHVERNCAPGRLYSGCALDVAGCIGAYIESALPDDYCARPGYVGCVTGPLEQYLKCLKGCNDDFFEGAINTFGILPCRLACQEDVDAGTKACKEGRMPPPPRKRTARAPADRGAATREAAQEKSPDAPRDDAPSPGPSRPAPPAAPGTRPSPGAPTVPDRRTGAVPPPLPADPGRGEFGGAPLDRRFRIVTPNRSSTVRVTEQGRLRMTASPRSGGSDFWPGPNNNAPRVLVPVSGDWTLETRVRFAPKSAFQGAGILVCFDGNPENPDCWRIIERQFYGRGQIVNFSGNQKDFTGATTFLRVSKRGASYIAWFSPDGRNWTEAGRREDARPPRFAGVMTMRQPYDGDMNLDSVAEFDYLRVTRE